jgi:DtxR family transcriptional regulator, Mn-dependent transcriptional regulator
MRPSLNESVEDYLETILVLSKKLPVVRAIDIANELGYSKASISVAIKNLKEKELIVVQEHGYISLTESGLTLATQVYERHLWFTNWLISLGVDEEIASEDACRMEHALSEESFEAIKQSINI